MQINILHTATFANVLYHDDRGSVCFVGVKEAAGQFRETKCAKCQIVDAVARAKGEHAYISVNSFFSPWLPRSTDNLRQVNAIFVDMDCHADDPTRTRETIKEETAYLIRAIEEGWMPRPTIIVDSGRGLHLYYIYERSIPARLKGGCANDKGLAVHADLTRKIYARVSSVLDGRALTVDCHCTDLSRYARVPGTVNPHTGTFCTLIRWNGPFYSFDSLYDALRRGESDTH